jgi:hypothetical protein
VMRRLVVRRMRDAVPMLSISKFLHLSP